MISLKMMVAHYEVTYTSKDKGWVFIVHTSKAMVEFMHHSRGLHYLDLSKKKNAEIMLATTLQDTFEGYTKSQIKVATNARCLQTMLDHPSGQ